MQSPSLSWYKPDSVIIRSIYEICFAIPGTNEIGAKLTQKTITDYANLIVMDAYAGTVSLNTRLIHGFPRATAGEIFASRDDARFLHKCTQQMIFAAVSTSLLAALLCISTC